MSCCVAETDGKNRPEAQRGKFENVCMPAGLRLDFLLFPCGSGCSPIGNDTRASNRQEVTATERSRKEGYEYEAEEVQSAEGSIVSRTLRKGLSMLTESPKSRCRTPVDASPFSRRSSESLNFSRLFEGHSGEWWLEKAGTHERSNGTEVLREGWWGRRPQGNCGRSRTGPLVNGPRRWLRRKVAGGRHRFDQHGFDLDLAYVTSRVIAMGFPSHGFATCWRNPHSEVGRFLRWAHGDRVRIYNLCAEKLHTDNGFPDNTVSYPFADHSPPDFPSMLHFCKDAESWLTEDEHNVIAIHCKAGKGRSGTMACALLVYAGAVSSAEEALRWFGHVRGGKRAGVTIPSQIRWVAMFENWLQGKVQLTSDPMSACSLRYRPQTLLLGPLRPELCQQSNSGERTVLVNVGLATRSAPGGFGWVHWCPQRLAQVSDNGMVTIDLTPSPVWVEHDGMVCVLLRCPGTYFRPVSLKLRAWWQHAFLRKDLRADSSSRLVIDLPKAFIDNLQRDAVKHRLAPADFRLVLEFAEAEEE
eukprot:TRINITY_DN33633_c0_g1_i1.p1 TRINITY_DN33633_c0_g1~~TRINITY_DN33633_c0_g1_i1.p1  ORF type:complete len:528 (-),score=57.15 TRINITY_DN33633_c0_g1_i1:158-1741(-)